MKHRVTVTREGRYWVGVVEGVRGGATEARTLAGLHEEVPDLLAGLLDVDPDQLELDWDYEPALGATAQAVQDLGAARDQLRSARKDYEEARGAVVRQLLEERVSLRDAQVLVGLSFQRVAQIARASASAR